MPDGDDPLFKWAKQRMTHTVALGKLVTEGDMVMFFDNGWRHGRLIEWGKKHCRVLYLKRIRRIPPTEVFTE